MPLPCQSWALSYCVLAPTRASLSLAAKREAFLRKPGRFSVGDTSPWHGHRRRQHAVLRDWSDERRPATRSPRWATTARTGDRATSHQHQPRWRSTAVMTSLVRRWRLLVPNHDASPLRQAQSRHARVHDPGCKRQGMEDRSHPSRCGYSWMDWVGTENVWRYDLSDMPIHRSRITTCWSLAGLP